MPLPRRPRDPNQRAKLVSRYGYRGGAERQGAGACRLARAGALPGAPRAPRPGLPSQTARRHGEVARKAASARWGT